MNIESLKIALAGSGGAGKTTLMNAWSDKYGVKKLQLDTKSVMPKGISNHLDVIKMASDNPSEGVKFQERLIRGRAQLFNNANTGFISDRAVVDSYAYYSIHNSMFASEELDKDLRTITFESVNDIDLTVFVSPDLSKNNGVPENGIRVNSLSYYTAISSVIFKSLQEALNSELIIESAELEVTQYTRISIALTKRAAVCGIIENHNPLGIASTNDRIMAIEKACEFLRLVRNK